MVGVNVNWKLVPTICGAGDETFTQFPSVRLVHDCRVKPAEARGQDRVRFVWLAVRLMFGLLVLRVWLGPSMSVAAIWAGESVTL